MSYKNDSKKIYIKLMIKRLEEEIALHKKYFPKYKIDIKSIFNSCRDDINLSKKEMENILSHFND